MNPHVRRIVCRSVIMSLKSGKLLFNKPIGALVYRNKLSQALNLYVLTDVLRFKKKGDMYVNERIRQRPVTDIVVFEVLYNG